MWYERICTFFVLQRSLLLSVYIRSSYMNGDSSRTYIYVEMYSHMLAKNPNRFISSSLRFIIVETRNVIRKFTNFYLFYVIFARLVIWFYFLFEKFICKFRLVVLSWCYSLFVQQRNENISIGERFSFIPRLLNFMEAGERERVKCKFAKNFSISANPRLYFFPIFYCKVVNF